MGTTSKITGKLATAISKVSGTVISGLANIMGQVISLFTDDNAVAKSTSTGSGEAVYITDSNGHYTFDHDDAFTVSFWIKVGWNVSVNTTIHLFASAEAGAASANKDSFRIWYYEPHNRMYAEWRGPNGSNKRQNFWFFHANSSSNNNSAVAYAAAGLGTSYWNSSNRGNANGDGYTLITFTRGTTNSGASSNLKLYWNDATCGIGYYASGNGGGTPSMGTDDKQITLGSQAWGSFTQSGNNDETKFNGVTIWDKVLSSSEVTELYNSGTPMNVANHSAYDASCVGWWNFESDGSNEVSGGPSFTINGDSNIEAK
jgi:hypothetical protein